MASCAPQTAGKAAQTRAAKASPKASKKITPTNGNFMKTASLFTAIAMVTLNACAAPDPAKPAAKTDAPPTAVKPAAVTAVSAPLPAANAAPLRLAPGQALPTSLSELTIIDREIGDPGSALVGKDSPILVHYTGWLYDASKPDGKGVQFDTSRTRVAPFSFIVGYGKVIKGWDQGVVGMRINGKRTIIIPAALAYGDRERPNIPANSNLIFDVDVLNIIGAGSSGQTTLSSTPTAPVRSAPLPVENAAPLRLNAKASLPMPP